MKDAGSNTIVTIDKTPVTSEEFLYVFNKNNQNQQSTGPDDIEEYLQLFINFKLKVREAEVLGLDKDSAFIEELEGYRKQLANPYLTETRLLDSLAMVTYDRLKSEINASHILILVDENTAPEDTLAAYEKIQDLYDQVQDGKDFNQLAFQHSEDPSAKQNKGNLGYFTAMQMVYPFEDAAYKLELDSVSLPVKTSFGYHLIKVHDKRPSQGRIQVSHILVRAQQGIAQRDSILAANRAFEIHAKAAGGDNWGLLCRQFSEDVGTKMNGGQLPWFKTGDISNIPAFEKAAFELKNIGDISPPVKTAYGWHIIRLDNKQGLESFEALETKIRTSLSAKSRAELNQEELVKRLKKENHFKEDEEVINNAISFANETLNKGTWKYQDHWTHIDQVIFSIQKVPYSVKDFYQYVEETQPLRIVTSPDLLMREAYQRYTKKSLIDFEEQHLADKYYDYKMLLKEYRDGILLFQLMESKVWNQAIEDTVGLYEFFDAHRDQYQWEERATARIFNVSDESGLQQVKDFINKGYFEYSKYDFYSSEDSFNKAQIRILNDISQLLIQGQSRYLTLEYDTSNPAHTSIYENIVKQLSMNSIESSRLEVDPLPAGSQEFIIYVASTSIKDLTENMNKRNPLTIQVESGQFQKGEHQLLDEVDWAKGVHQIEVDDRIVLIEISDILPPTYQEMDEIKGQVISDYQTELETEWVEELRNKYPVEINQKEVEKVYEKIRQLI